MAPSSSAGHVHTARVAGLLRLLFVAGALPCAAQVMIQTVAPTTSSTLQAPKAALIPVALGDLIITAVTVQDVDYPSPSTIAQVSIQNKGAASATFPAGSVLARGNAAVAGGLAFQPMAAPGDYTIAAGESKTLMLSVGSPCAAGSAGTVTFVVDPDNRVHESDENNNVSAVASVGSFVKGDLRAVGVDLETTAPNQGAVYDPFNVPAGYAAALRVYFVNVGAGTVLVCPGDALWGEAASPVSGKYGLRSLKNNGTAPQVYRAGVQTVSKLPAALGAGDLPPGSFNWAVKMNPDGKVRESSVSNNAASTTVKVY